MKNLVIDFGNSRIKTGLFEAKTLQERNVFENVAALTSWLHPIQVNHCLISSVVDYPVELEQAINRKGKLIRASADMPLPITIQYATPQTLGVDRIAAACGAIDIFPGQPCLAIDVGTCINYEFVDENKNYLGGAISPGVGMRFSAMHTFTAKLPLVSTNATVSLIGNSTETCMQSGVMHGVWAEVSGIIERYHKNYDNLGVVMCGGDHALFENKLNPSIFVTPNLVLSGLNGILIHNAGY